MNRTTRKGTIKPGTQVSAGAFARGCGMQFWHAALLLLSFAAVGEAAAAANDDQDHWYATVAAGKLLHPRNTGADITLGGIAPIELAGHVEYADGTAVTATVGRQVRWDDDPEEDSEQHWRAEAELWHGRAERDGVDAGILQADLDDKVTATALFINAQYRLAATTHTRWWLGVGLGYARVRMPDASQVANCSCLGPAYGTGTAGRIKLSVEYTLSPRTALFLQLGYVALPDASTQLNAGSVTKHSGLRSSEGVLGFLMRL